MQNDRNRFLVRAIVWYAYIRLILTLIIFQYGFYVYHLTPFLWEIKDADVIETDSYSFKYKGNEYAYVRQATVEYMVNNDRKKQSLVLLSYCEKEGDRIKIAVNKKKNLTCIRYEWLPLRDDMDIFFIIIIIAQVYSFFIEKKRGRNSVISIASDNYQNTDDTSQQKRYFKWQFIIDDVLDAVIIALCIFVIIIMLIIVLE